MGTFLILEHEKLRLVSKLPTQLGTSYIPRSIELHPRLASLYYPPERPGAGEAGLAEVGEGGDLVPGEVERPEAGAGGAEGVGRQVAHVVAGEAQLLQPLQTQEGVAVHLG